MMDYCYECGEKLIIKELEHEGMIPFCPKCNQYRFPIFSSAVSVIILDKDKKKTLLVKQYHTNKYRLVAGYINKGESAEEALVREMGEELGVKPIEYKLLKTLYFDKSNTLMINFYAVLDNYNVNPNYEIDEYAWVDIEDCEANLAEAKIALQFFKYYQSIREEDYGNF